MGSVALCPTVWLSEDMSEDKTDRVHDQSDSVHDRQTVASVVHDQCRT